MIITPSPNETAQNIHPVIPSTFNGVVLVGDIPYDERATMPFQNSHYGALSNLLREAKVSFYECIQANLLPFYPDNGFIGDEQALVVAKSLASLKETLARLVPKVIITFGRQTLRHFKPGASALDSERGAPFRWNGHLVIPTFHPRELFAEYHNLPVTQFDILKAIRLGNSGWVETPLEIIYQPTFPECVRFLQQLVEKRPYISTDWESVDSILGKYSLATCIGIGINAKKAFVIPFVKEGNKSYFPLEEECIIWRLLSRALECCPQIGHNALHYDHWFGAWHNKILMNVVDDTMFAHWEVYTEMEKSLSFCASLYLDVPYWKDELKLARSGKVPRNREFLYCGRDTCITIAVGQAIGKELKELPPSVRAHYRFNVRCSRIFQYMSIRGAYIDRDLLRAKLIRVESDTKELQNRLESEAGRSINVSSPKQMKEWLYRDLKLPARTKGVKQDDGSVEEKETADFLALAYMAREYESMPFLMTAATLRKSKKRLSSLKAIVTGPNGECYWNFGLVSTETGRAAGYKPNNGMGVQPQNVDRRDRDIFLPGPPSQPEWRWAKCDLEGADAWTVAGQLSVLGDDTMLNDLKAGLKPAQILSLATIVGEHVISWPQDKLVELLKIHKPFLKTPAGKKIYETDKSVSHGTNYMMQAKTMHMTIFTRSKAELFVPIRECEKRRLLYLRRYPSLEKLYAHIPTIINTHGFLDCPSGMRRVFFGRPDNHRTRVGLALLPQNNTAYATNRCLLNLFNDGNNRLAGTTELILQPINQVHDEADLAFRIDDLDRVRSIFHDATQFDSEVWGVKFRIPFDSNYGLNWGNCEESL